MATGGGKNGFGALSSPRFQESLLLPSLAVPQSSPSSFILAWSSVFVKSLFPGVLVKKRSNNCLTLQLLEAVDANVNK